MMMLAVIVLVLVVVVLVDVIASLDIYMCLVAIVPLVHCRF